MDMTLAGRYTPCARRVATERPRPRTRGQHRFCTVQPGVGPTGILRPLSAHGWRPAKAGAPTPVELTAPIRRLQASAENFLADPPLAKVIARTAEVGARGHWEGEARGAQRVRHTLDNDIQFSSRASGAECWVFQERRHDPPCGVELALRRRLTRGHRRALRLDAGHVAPPFRASRRTAARAKMPHRRAQGRSHSRFPRISQTDRRIRVWRQGARTFQLRPSRPVTREAMRHADPGDAFRAMRWRISTCSTDSRTAGRS